MRKFDKNKLKVIAINLDRGPKKKAIAFFEDNNIKNSLARLDIRANPNLIILIYVYTHLGTYFAELAFSHWVNERGKVSQIYILQKILFCVKITHIFGFFAQFNHEIV